MPATKELVEQLLADPKQAVCPQCGNTGFWDNREKAKGKAPWFVCRNKEECAAQSDKGFAFGVFSFEVKKHAPAATAAPAAKNGAPKSPVSWKQIRTAYAECVALALKGAEQIGAKGMTIEAENVTVMVNGLMMTRERVNCWPPQVPATPTAPVEVAKPKAVVPPRDERPYDFEDATDEDSSLPF